MTPSGAQTRYIDIYPLNQTFDHKVVDESLALLAQELTKAVQLMPGLENVEVSYRNILERDDNPAGHRAFFRFTNIEPKAATITHIQFRNVSELPAIVPLFV